MYNIKVFNGGFLESASWKVARRTPEIRSFDNPCLRPQMLNLGPIP